MPAKYNINQKVIYRLDDGALTKTGVIQKVLPATTDDQPYEIKPDDGGSSSSNITVKESAVVRLNENTQ